MRLRVGVITAAAAALIAAGCGGSAGGNQPGSAGGASVAPADAAAYVSVDSNIDSAGWTKAQALLDRFPGKDEVIDNLNSSLEQNGLDWETDIKPALGDEIDLVWLDFRNKGEDVVGVTKPGDVDKFNALLAKGSSPVAHAQIDGWTVFAHDQALLDRFTSAADSGTLDGESSFTDTFNGLPSDSIVRAWVSGDTLQSSLDQRLQTAGAPANTTRDQIGTLDALTAALTPGSDGVSITSTFSGDLDLGGSEYQAELPSVLPSGAIFYLSFKGVGTRINSVIDSLGSSIPNFDQQRAQIELVLGYPLEDVFDLLSGEGALAVYPSAASGTPAVLFAVDVSDESKARNILDRLATLAAASGNLHVQSTQIGSVEAKEITLANGTSAFVAVFDGRLVITNSRLAIQRMAGDGPKLADDSAYSAAVSSADVPAETSGFVYADLNEALEYAFDYAENQGKAVPQVVKDNTAPLRGLLLYGSKDGGNFSLTGFVGTQ